jgi:hypothetical protein
MRTVYFVLAFSDRWSLTGGWSRISQPSPSSSLRYFLTGVSFQPVMRASSESDGLYSPSWPVCIPRLLSRLHRVTMRCRAIGGRSDASTASTTRQRYAFGSGPDDVPEFVTAHRLCGARRWAFCRMSTRVLLRESAFASVLVERASQVWTGRLCQEAARFHVRAGWPGSTQQPFSHSSTSERR